MLEKPRRRIMMSHWTPSNAELRLVPSTGATA